MIRPFDLFEEKSLYSRTYICACVKGRWRDRDRQTDRQSRRERDKERAL